MPKAQVKVERETTQPLPDGDTLCFQQVRYYYENGTFDEGFRFIRKTKDGKLRAQRGQANVMSLKMVRHLLTNFERQYEFFLDRTGFV